VLQDGPRVATILARRLYVMPQKPLQLPGQKPRWDSVE